MIFSLRKSVENMNKFWIVTKHTYLSRVNTKSFRIITAIMLLLIFVSVNITKIIDLFDDGQGERIGIVAPADIYSQIESNLTAGDSELKLTAYPDEKQAETAIADEKIVGYLVVSDQNGVPAGTFKTTVISDQSVPSELEAALQQVKVYEATQSMSISQEDIAQIYAPVEFNKVAIAASSSGSVSVDENAKTDKEMEQAVGLVYISLFFIYMSVMLYANMVATDVASEKNSRIMEILISSIPPIQQMFAKILGVAMLSITQIALMLGTGYLAIKLSGSDVGLELSEIPVATIVYGVIFMILGYFLYATIAAVIGSMVNRVEEVQQAFMPIMMLIVIGFIIAMTGLGVPEANYVTVTSFIPFFTPMIMFLRVGLLDIPFWQPALSIVMMLASIVVIGLVGSRIYKGGVLMYGKTNVWKDFRKAIQMGKKE